MLNDSYVCLFLSPLSPGKQVLGKFLLLFSLSVATSDGSLNRVLNSN